MWHKHSYVHVNQSQSEQAVFKVAAFPFDASVKTFATAWLPCQSLAGQVACRRDTLTQWLQGKGRTVKVMLEQIVCDVIRTINNQVFAQK